MLQNISVLKEQSAQLGAIRHEEAEEELIFGVLCLEKFEQTGFNDAELLKEACRRLIQSIRLNTRDIRPHLSLIYLFTLIEDFDTAALYVASAQAIELENPFLEAMQEFWREARRQASQTSDSAVLSVLTSGPALSVSDDEIDYDALYDQVEARIKTLIRELSEQAPPAPTLRAERIEQMSHQLEQLRQQQHALTDQIQIIDQEIDSEDLLRAIKPLEVSLQRWEQKLTLSRQLLALQQQIEQAQQATERATAHAHAAEQASVLPELEAEVEHLLESCDRCADQLDQFEQQGVTFSTLLNAYEKLVAAVESLQDLLEDTHERLRA